MSERLQKIIAASGLMARRKAEELIAAGRVTVNGNLATLGDSADPERDTILVDGAALPAAGAPVTILYHKPRGVVSSLHDEQGRRDLAGLTEEVGCRVYPVGRLDFDSEGLLLLTNDGALAQRLMHPSHEVEKVYRTWVKGEDIARRAEILRGAMEIDGYAIRPARVELRETLPEGAVLDITIHEGRNRQVRKMCQQVGLTVTRLCRIREGGITLGGLRPGKWRRLTEEELRRLEAEG